MGDGSIQYAIQALWTVAQLGVRVLVVVLHNGEYAAMKGLSLTLGANHPPSYNLPGIDIVSLSEGYGCDLRIDEPDTVVEAARKALNSEVTTVLDIPFESSVTALYA